MRLTLRVTVPLLMENGVGSPVAATSSAVVGKRVRMSHMRVQLYL